MRLSYGYKGEERHMRFYSPDDGSSGGGGQGAAGTTEEIKTPFDDINLDELGPTERAAIESGKLQFRTIMAGQKSLEGKLGRQEELTRRFQSDADRSKAELERIFGSRGATNPTETTVSAVVRDALKGAGYKDADIEKLGPMFSVMLEQVGAIQTKAIGDNLRPMAVKVIEQEAEAAFNAARQTSPMGIMQIPTVAEGVWKYVQERTKAGQQTTPEIALSLAKMVYVDFVDAERAAGREVKTIEEPVQTPPANGNATMKFTYPGSSSNVRPPVTKVAENHQGTALNADTEAALATTFKNMTSGLSNAEGKQITPKALEGAISGGRRK